MKKLILSLTILVASFAASAEITDNHRCRAIDPSTPEFTQKCQPRSIMYDYEWVVQRYKTAYSKYVASQTQLEQMAKKVKKLEAQIAELKANQ